MNTAQPVSVSDCLEIRCTTRYGPSQQVWGCGTVICDLSGVLTYTCTSSRSRPHLDHKTPHPARGTEVAWETGFITLSLAQVKWLSNASEPISYMRFRRHGTRSIVTEENCPSGAADEKRDCLVVGYGCPASRLILRGGKCFPQASSGL